MSNKIDEKFRKIEDRFSQLALQNKEELEHAKIKSIHDKYPWAQNGITAFIAGMGSGKSYNCLKLIAKQEVLFKDPFYETVALCSTSGEFDKTTQTFKQAISKSKLIAIKDTELLTWLEEYMAKVLLYNNLIKYVNDGFKKPCEEMQKIINENNLHTHKRAIEFIS